MTSLPTRSPVFQSKKARGMNVAGRKSRGVDFWGSRTERIPCVKTGKTIVMAKQRNMPSASHLSFLKRVSRGMTLCSGCGCSCSSSSSAWSSRFSMVLLAALSSLWRRAR